MVMFCIPLKNCREVTIPFLSREKITSRSFSLIQKVLPCSQCNSVVVLNSGSSIMSLFPFWMMLVVLPNSWMNLPVKAVSDVLSAVAGFFTSGTVVAIRLLVRTGPIVGTRFSTVKEVTVHVASLLIFQEVKGAVLS